MPPILFAPARGPDAHRPGPDAGNQRGVARINAKLAGFARQDDELRLAGKDRLFGADHVHVHRICHVYLRVNA
jgi:hypothetical protein